MGLISFFFNTSGRTQPDPARLYNEAREGDPHGVHDLLAAGCDPNAPGENGRRAVHAAAFWGHPDILLTLKKHKADIFILDNEGHSVLHAAAMGYKGRLNVFVWVFASVLDVHVNVAAHLLDRPEKIRGLAKEKEAQLQRLRVEILRRDKEGRTPSDILLAKNGHEAQAGRLIARKLDSFISALDNLFPAPTPVALPLPAPKA